MNEGILIIDKPKGMTSHDVVDHVRKVLRLRRVGHSGTLDPMASGVLVILVGKATKLFKEFLDFEKGYTATLTLGKVTDTGDADGKVIQSLSCPQLTEETIREVFKEFMGEIQQIPPMVSAVRYKGKRLYQFARLGVEVPRKARRVTIKELKLIEFNTPEIKFYIRCSSGTYIRQLACDIAGKLGCGGYISQIERLNVGPYDLKNAIKLNQVNESHIRAWAVKI
jgi:tRNA pseudouridine55 synthase